MIPEHESAGRTVAAHVIHLFDHEDSRADCVAAFAHASLQRGETLLLALTMDHWTAVRARLGGRELDRAIEGGRLVVLDAADTLRRFTSRGRPDAERFDASVGALVRGLASRGRPLSVYGEMVDLLAIAGDFDGALELEDLWDGLARRQPFTLACGYSAVSFGDPRSAAALRALCAAHSHVVSAPEDVLGAFLLETYR